MCGPSPLRASRSRIGTIGARQNWSARRPVLSTGCSSQLGWRGRARSSWRTSMRRTRGRKFWRPCLVWRATSGYTCPCLRAITAPWSARVATGSAGGSSETVAPAEGARLRGRPVIHTHHGFVERGTAASAHVTGGRGADAAEGGRGRPHQQAPPAPCRASGGARWGARGGADTHRACGTGADARPRPEGVEASWSAAAGGRGKAVSTVSPTVFPSSPALVCGLRRPLALLPLEEGSGHLPLPLGCFHLHLSLENLQCPSM